MRTISVNPGLTNRLLVTIARLHTAGQGGCDWPLIAAAAGGDAGPAAVQRALAALAEDGLIEGVCTPSGWLRINVTDLGLRRAGRAGRQPLPDVRYWHTAGPATPTTPVAESSSPHTAAADAGQPHVSQPAVAQVDPHLADAESGAWPAPSRNPLEPLAAGLRDAWRRSLHALAPRVAAVRTQVAQAWRLLTTFP